MNPDCYHIPVMLEECIEGLNIKSNGIYLDLTYGGGGHSKEIIKHLAPEGHLYGFDQDLDAMNGAITDERFTFIRSNYFIFCQDIICNLFRKDMFFSTFKK